MVDTSFLELPSRAAKPRGAGLTHVMDQGIPPRAARDLLATTASWTDVWKMGFGTAYLDPTVSSKLSLLLDNQVRACVGGTLLEVAWLQAKADDCLAWAADLGFPLVEVSNGVCGMPSEEKRRLIVAAADRFTVVAEVGSKDPSAPVSPQLWALEMAADLDAGARWVIAEGRESGTVGLYRPDGSVREELVDALVQTVDVSAIIFEAPRRSQQAWFIRQFGPDVNLANIQPTSVLALEALRAGLRADTFSHVAAPPARIRR